MDTHHPVGNEHGHIGDGDKLLAGGRAARDAGAGARRDAQGRLQPGYQVSALSCGSLASEALAAALPARLSSAMYITTSFWGDEALMVSKVLDVYKRQPYAHYACWRSSWRTRQA